MIDSMNHFTIIFFQLFHLAVLHLVDQMLFARKTLDHLRVSVILVTKVTDTAVQVSVRCTPAIRL